jgi:sRNA-binding protein
MAATQNPETRRRKRWNQRQRALPQIEALYEELHQRFPNTFFREPEKISPLKKGIYHDIKAAFPPGTFNTRVLDWTLHRYSYRYVYVRAVAAGKPRIDLSGNPVGVVTEDEQQQAVERLKTWRRQRRKPRQVNQTKDQGEGKSHVADTTGERVTEEQVGTVTEDQKESQPTTAQRKSTKKRSGKSGKGDKVKDQDEKTPLSAGTPVATVTNDKQKAPARRKTTKKRSGKSDKVAKMKE